MKNVHVRAIASLWLFISASQSSPLPPKCCFPSQYETFIYATNGLQYGDNYGFGNSTIRTAFDGVNQLTFTHEHSYSVTNVFPIPITEDYTNILEYKANIQWRVYNDQSCDKLDVGLPLYEECIPGNATLLSEGMFGAGLYTKTYLFHDRIYLDPYEITITVVMSNEIEGECWPVRMSFSSAYVFDSNKNVDITTGDILDFTLGIKDSSIFVPPSSCPQATKQTQTTTMTRGPGGLKETMHAFSARMRQNIHGGQ